MVNGDILDDIVLATGSYPQHYGGRTGAELAPISVSATARETAPRSHVSLSFTDAAFVFEGPLHLVERARG